MRDVRVAGGMWGLLEGCGGCEGCEGCWREEGVCYGEDV